MKDNIKNTILEYYEKYGPIEIKCTGADMLPIDDIKNFQGNLKKRTDKDLLKLIKNMFMNGFIDAFSIWNDDGTYRILNGHGREDALSKIKAAGVPILEAFPVSYVHPQDEAEARKFLLSIDSSYGHYNQATLDEWVSEINNDIANTLLLRENEIKLAIAEVTTDVENITKVKQDKTDDNVKLIIKGITRADATEIMTEYIAKGYSVEVR